MNSVAKEGFPTPLLMGQKRMPRAERIAELLALLADLSLVVSPKDRRGGLNVKHNKLPELLPVDGQRITPKRLLCIWRDILDGKCDAGVVDLLCMEFWVSVDYRGVLRELDASKGRFTYSNTLLAVRKRVAYSLYEYAKGINWQQPVAYVSALKVARAYLRDAAGHGDAIRWPDFGQFAGKLGVSTVLISGFEDVSSGEADEAYRAIRRSLEYGNDRIFALPYLVDAAVLRFDLNRKREQLVEAINLTRCSDSRVRSAALLLSIAQAKLRLVVEDAHVGSFDEILRLVDGADEISDGRPTEALQIAMIRGVVGYLRSNRKYGVRISGLRIPFGYRTGQAVHPLLLVSSKNIYREIYKSGRISDPMVAGVLSNLIVSSRENLGISEREALEASVRYRAGDDLPSRLVGLHDELRLAALEESRHRRFEVANNLGDLAKDPRVTSTVHMILADDVERNGPLSDPVEEQSVALCNRAGRSLLIELGVRGDFEGLWSVAAKSALANANLTQVGLGGRSGVTTVGDYYGLIAETLVYKQMDKATYERGSARAAEIAQYLAGHGLLGDFDVSRNVGADESDGKIVVARRYVAGRSLMRHLEDGGQGDCVRYICMAARFLGVINRAESAKASELHVRRQLKVKEVGRFLKTCGVGDHAALFDRWWAVVKDVDKVTRRDSHLDNWLLSEDGRIIALDLDAVGSRPVGYDLAQLTDDHSFLEPDDWGSRRVVFDAYMDEVEVTSDRSACWRSYKAGILARMLWAITSPERATRFCPGEAEQRILRFAETVGDVELQEIAMAALGSLLKQRGLDSLPIASKNTTGAGRVRLSKQVAWHLRHNLVVERDEEGWVQIEALCREVHAATALEVLTIATDPREVRFEVSGDLIRARYGHNAALNLAVVFDVNPKRDLVLYHASPWKHARSILDEGQGLRAQERQMVHLTDSLVEAVANGVRGGHPLVYETQVGRLNGVRKEGMHTYVTGDVKAFCLAVVPVCTYWRQLPAVGNLGDEI